MSERPMSSVQSRYPLSGITVIDLSHFYNGPYATFLMAMAGANVAAAVTAPNTIRASMLNSEPTPARAMPYLFTRCLPY